MDQPLKFHADSATDKLTNGNNTEVKETPTSDIHQLDALIVGAGFAGTYQLKRLRDLGYNVLLVEAGSDYGGTWFWNRYPGARVDTAAPQYQFSDPNLWKHWNPTQRFPGSPEIRAYFKHVAEKWDLRKDTRFDTFIESASWDSNMSKWAITSDNGTKYMARYFLLCTGCLSKQYIPEWKGVDKYRGLFIHPASWPQEEPDLKDKKIAIIGTGATAVQMVQELSKVASQLTVFQRTPNTALPLGQVNYGADNEPHTHDEVEASLAARSKSFPGMDYSFLPRKTFEDTPEKRIQTFEQLWQEGGFRYWLATYNDMLFSQEANTEAYNFWRDKTRARINDRRIAELLAPMKQEYAFGCKRIPLENGYFEAFNETHVKLVDTKTTPIEEITEKGINTSAGEMEFDAIIAATGYDAFTGTLTRIRIRGKDGQLLTDRWKDGVKTHLGMAMHGFPNMFFAYGPQAPTPLFNGPSSAEMQGNWISDTIDYLHDHGYLTIEATEAAEKKWKKEIIALANDSLLPSTKSWYMGDNIPCKPREPLAYLGGVPKYYETLNKVKETGYEGFVLSNDSRM